jgi:hypothetical protein
MRTAETLICQLNFLTRHVQRAGQCASTPSFLDGAPLEQGCQRYYEAGQ